MSSASAPPMAINTPASRRRASGDQPFVYTYSERDVILYALSVGAHDQQYVYERAPGFQVLPTFGIVAAFGACNTIPLRSLLPCFDNKLLLHGEQYMRLEGSLPTTGQLRSRARVIDIQDKGKAALVILGIHTEDEQGQRVCYNEVTYFIRGSGGFGDVKRILPQRDVAATALNDPPLRPPDFTVREATMPCQAALYRLNGDFNPLHIDTEAAATASFPRPILHGLCTLGISVKHVLQIYASTSTNVAQSIKVRFSGHVFPGETLLIDVWQVDMCTVLFKTSVEERNVVAISQAAVIFQHPVYKGVPTSQRAAAKL